MAHSQFRQQLIIGLTGSAILSAIVGVTAVATQRHDEGEVGPMVKVNCTVSPRPVIAVNGEDYVIDPPDVVIPC